MDTLSKYIQACSMNPNVRLSRPKQVGVPPQRLVPSFAVHASYGVSQCQSRVSHINYNPYQPNSGHRISAVSSQKLSEATRSGGILNCHSQVSFTPRSRLPSTQDIRGLFTPPASQRNLVTPYSPPTVHNNLHSQQRIISQVTQPSPGRQPYVQNSPPMIQHYPAPDMNPQRLSTFTTAYLNQSLDNSVVVHHNLPLLSARVEVTQVTTRPLIRQKSVQSLSKSTVVQVGPPLVGNVTVQNIQMAPIIRNPPKITRNRLYKSAVDGMRAGSVSRVMRSSRAHSTVSSNNKLKKAKVLIRGNYRSIISDKKIPVLGSYYSNDKDKSFVIRQLSSHHGSNVIGSSILGMELQEIIPTQVIKIPIGKTGDLRESQVDSCYAFEDINQSSFSEYSILDQPGLIKKYTPQFESRIRRNQLMKDQDCQSVSGMGRSSCAHSSISSRSRLTDSIKISVYRSPDVVIKKAIIITSGPKLTKEHVKRILVQGKDVSPARQSRILRKQSKNSSQKSSSPIAKYESKKDQFELFSTPSNPYIRKDVNDIIQKLRKRSELFQRENNHLRQQQSSTKSSGIVPQTNQDSEEYPIRMAQCHRVQSIQHVSQVFPVTVPVSQYHTTQPTKAVLIIDNSSREQTHLIQEYTQKRFEVQRQLVKNKADRQDTTVHSDDLSYLSSNIQSRHLSTHTHQFLYSWQTLGRVEVQKQIPTMTLESLNRHRYDIPKLADDLEEDLRRLDRKEIYLSVSATSREALFG